MQLTGSSKRPKDMGILMVVGGPGGSGSSTIAKMLSRHFQLHYVYGGAFMRMYAEQFGYASLSEFFSSKEFKEKRNEFDRMIDARLLKASNWRNVLIDSKVFAAIATNLQIPCTVKIWLDSPLHTRVRRTLNKEGRIGLDKNLPKYSEIYKLSEIRLRDRYHKDKARYKEIYGIDYSKPHKYNDIVIDTSAFNEGQTMQIILKMLKDGKYLEQ
jgi:CMP/dCMP kinase